MPRPLPFSRLSEKAAEFHDKPFTSCQRGADLEGAHL
jgi:hypothetical protein